MSFRTQAQVDRLLRQKPGKERWESDELCSGLYLRLQNRRAAWYAWLPRNAAGKRPKAWLADASVKLEDARELARPLVKAAKAGHDVVAQRRAAREAVATRSADTLRRMIDAYLQRKAKPNQKARSYAETERILLKTWAPLHDRPVEAITRKDIADHLETVRTTRGPFAAKAAHGYLSTAFVWAMKAGLADHNPCAMTEEPDTPSSKARALEPAELVQIWNACEHMGEYGTIIRLLMLTGQRRSEVAGVFWSEIDVDRRLWRIHSLRTKNGREHEVPLTDLALSLLPPRRPGRSLLFGLRAGAFSGFSHAKERLDKHIALANAERRLGRPLAKGEELAKEDAPSPWRPHDLRHSFVTHCAEIGIDPHVIEACVNHVSGHKGGIAGVYNAAQYREQKRKAMERFSQWLEDQISGEQQSGVIRLHATA